MILTLLFYMDTLNLEDFGCWPLHKAKFTVLFIKKNLFYNISSENDFDTFFLFVVTIFFFVFYKCETNKLSLHFESLFPYERQFNAFSHE